MKAFITIYGDESVGIRNLCFTLDFQHLDVIDYIKTMEHVEKENARKLYKDILQKFVFDIFCEEAEIILEDECGDCHHDLVDGKCTNKNYISLIGEQDAENN